MLKTKNKGNFDRRTVIGEALSIIAERQYPIGDIKKRGLINSFRFAFQGFFYAFKTQANLRIHVIIAALVLSSALLLKFSYLEITLLCLVSMLVIVTEVINTALELSLDLVNGNKFNPLVKITKDVIAAGVLLASLNAVIIGAIIFLRHV